MGNFNLTYIYLIISVFVVCADFIIACHAFAEHKKSSYVLCMASVSSGFLQLVYILSTLTTTYFRMSLLTSLYYVLLGLTVMFWLIFVRANSEIRKDFPHKYIKHIMGVAFLIDAALFLINPFKEVIIHYAYVGGLVLKYEPIHKSIYWAHLIFYYILIVIILYHLISRAVAVPSMYRNKYLYSVYAIVLVVALNAVIVFHPTLFGSDALDYSIWGYSIATFFIYLSFFRYPVRGMRGYYHEWIVENINQGVVLFNYEGQLIIHNDKVHSIFPDSKIEDEMSIEEFSKQLNLEIKSERSMEDYSFQYYVKKNDTEYPIRFDHRCLKTDNGKSFGQLFVFTDEAGDVDLLTSFYTWENFKQVLKDEPENFNPPVIVSVCDINGLGEINSRLGKNVGDQAIRILSNIIRKHFSGESYYVRGQEASLIILSFDIDEKEAYKKLELVREEINSINDLGCIIDIQSGVGIVKSPDQDVLTVVKEALKGMKNKKLLDIGSRRSELVLSLIKALEECDNDTEAHVKRTQTMGAELGKRLGLSDMQQSNLALLCILHDIGKIGIPLEILNKPSRLNDSEWRMMKTHTEKGYQIAVSSQELSHIADMIRHHHECWDGHGYPDGLTKESIPLLSRIISVVDAFDAMVNDRVYRPAMSVEAAINELKRCAGSQFDPGIVNEFIQMIHDLGMVENNSDTTTEINENDSVDMNIVGFADKREVQTNVYEVAYCRYVLDSKMRIVIIDNQFESLTGYSADDIKNNVITQIDLLPEEDRVPYMSMVSEQLANRNLAYFEHRLLRKDGSIAYVFCYGKVYYDSAEREERSEIIVFDSTNTHAMKVMVNEEMNKAEIRLSKWEDKYRCDSLTGLLNHEAFKNDIDMKLLEERAKVMLLMMDVDKFKQYNDTYGHRSGDEFLIMLSQSLTEALRKDDLACRMGGDEFAAALFYSDDVSDSIMLERAQQICDKLNLILSSQKGGTSLSMGVVSSDENAKGFNSLYEQADVALYKAKASGRAKMVIYSPEK